MRVVLDGSVCFDRFGACFNYYTQLVPRLISRGCNVTVTPSPTGALDGLNQSGAEIAQTLLPTASWLPQGPVRQMLSRQKQRLEKWRWGRKLAARGGEPTIFQSFYYGLPPSNETLFLPMVVDMIQEKFPQWYGDAAARVTKEQCVRRASRIITISENSKRDIVDYFGVNPKKIDVIYLGVDPIFQTPTAERTITAVQEKYRLPAPYFLQIGGRAHHKNFPRLFEAYARLAERDPIDLVCAGEMWSEEERAMLRASGVGDRVHLVHRPNQAELVALLHGSKGLLYPSLYEGFGIPPLEAMASGIPVAASRAGSILEVVGNAAALFDPLDVQEMVHALRTLRDPRQAESLRKQGLERAPLFSWDTIADQTVAAYGLASEKR